MDKFIKKFMILDYYLLRCIDFVKSGVLGLCNSFFIFKNKDKLYFFIKKKNTYFIYETTRVLIQEFLYFL